MTIEGSYNPVADGAMGWDAARIYNGAIRVSHKITKVWTLQLVKGDVVARHPAYEEMLKAKRIKGRDEGVHQSLVLGLVGVEVNHVQKSALLLPLWKHWSALANVVNFFHMAVCLTGGGSVVHVRYGSLLAMAQFAKPVSMTGIGVLDVEAMLPYPSRPRSFSMLAYGEPRETIPINAFIPSVVDRGRRVALSVHVGL